VITSTTLLQLADNMNARHSIIVIGIVVMYAARASAVDFLDPKSFFSGDKEVSLSDGSSLYIFHPNGEFSLEPLGLSGRTIAGKWRCDYGGLHITGMWSWINGSSLPNDRRSMDIHVGYIGSKTKDYNSPLTGKHYNIQEAYFVIDRLEKIIASPAPPQISLFAALPSSEQIEEAKKKMHLLKSGMTVEQVFSTLGLPKNCLGESSGPMSSYRETADLPGGHTLYLIAHVTSETPSPTGVIRTWAVISVCLDGISWPSQN